jgi:pyroglutamyl-peptidase
MNKILVTGFEGYGGRSDNPSAEIAKSIDGYETAGWQVVSRVLPVTNHNIRNNVVSLIDSFNPAAVLCLGLSPGESVVRIERLAANYSRFEIADNAGEQYCGEIVAGGPAAYEATLPVEQLLHAVLGCGVPARLSESAGTYLCNAIMYHALDYCSTSARNCLCGFIHLPYMPSQVVDVLQCHQQGGEQTRLASMSLQDQKHAVMAMVESLCARGSAAPV